MKLIKFIDAANVLPKVLQVCLSCTTEAHCLTAMSYLSQYVNRHRVGIENSIILRTCTHALTRYLQDTRDHANLGYHKPEHESYKTIKTWPNLTDYVGEILHTRFPGAWSRNSVVSLGKMRVQ